MTAIINLVGIEIVCIVTQPCLVDVHCHPWKIIQGRQEARSMGFLQLNLKTNYVIVTAVLELVRNETSAGVGTYISPEK